MVIVLSEELSLDNVEHPYRLRSASCCRTAVLPYSSPQFLSSRHNICMFYSFKYAAYSRLPRFF